MVLSTWQLNMLELHNKNCFNVIFIIVIVIITYYIT